MRELCEKEAVTPYGKPFTDSAIVPEPKEFTCILILALPPGIENARLSRFTLKSTKEEVGIPQVVAVVDQLEARSSPVLPCQPRRSTR